MSISYNKQLNNWIENEKSGVNLLNSVGTLMYDKGIELVLFRNQLLEIDTVNTTVTGSVDATATTGKVILFLLLELQLQRLQNKLVKYLNPLMA